MKCIFLILSLCIQFKFHRSLNHYLLLFRWVETINLRYFAFNYSISHYNSKGKFQVSDTTFRDTSINIKL